MVECTRGVLPSGGAECTVPVPGPGPGPVPDPGPVPVSCLVIFSVFIIGLVTILIPMLHCHGPHVTLRVPPGSGSIPRP